MGSRRERGAKIRARWKRTGNKDGILDFVWGKCPRQLDKFAGEGAGTRRANGKHELGSVGSLGQDSAAIGGKTRLANGILPSQRRQRPRRGERPDRQSIVAEADREEVFTVDGKSHLPNKVRSR